MRRRFPALFVSVLILSAQCFAAPDAKPQKPARAAQPAQAAQPSWEVKNGMRIERDIPYVHDGGPAQVLDLYLPEHAGEKPLPLVVWIHGGGWQGGSKKGCYVAYLVPHGYAVASVEYRFSQKAHFPAQIQDCQAALRFLRASARKYNIDPEHVGVGGDSAGGHLVALLGTSGGKHAFPPIGGNEDQSDRVQAVCDFYGPADFNTVIEQAAKEPVKNIFKFNTPSDPYSSLIGAKLDEDKAKTDAVSPVHYVSKDSAPILILHGTADALVPFAQSVELADALKKAGVDVILQKFPGSGHGGPAFQKPAVHDLIRSFFDKYLKGQDVKVEPLPESAVAVPAPPGASGAPVRP